VVLDDYALTTTMWREIQCSHHQTTLAGHVLSDCLSCAGYYDEAISRRRHSLFGHVRRMDQTAPAHQALHLSVMSRQGSGVSEQRFNVPLDTL